MREDQEFRDISRLAEKFKHVEIIKNVQLNKQNGKFETPFNINDLTAKKAREITDSINNLKNRTELEDCLNTIIKAINLGKDHILISHRLDNSVIRELGVRGFAVKKYEDQTDGSTIKISW
jgi:hypothetical protein